MSAAAASARVNTPTKGFAQVPNSLIENQVIFTRAELALALIVLRRGGQSEAVPVSDRNWQTWTGLSPRVKEYAIAGLRKKCITVQGRGDTARYSFARDQWDQFVRTVNRAPARTVGRAVEPRPGAKIHQACRDRGCALLASESGGPELVSPSPSAPNAQPVAQCSASQINLTSSPGEPAADPSAGGRGKLIPLSSAPNAQRVARMADGAEQLWTRTLGALQSIFPLIGIVFLVRLVATVRAVFHDIRDEELAEAVGFAWQAKARMQKSEGLFFLTVPAAVAHLRKKKPSRTHSGELHAPGLADGVRMLLERVAEALRPRGAPFAPILAELLELRGRVTDDVELETVEQSMMDLEGRIIAAARELLSDLERKTVAECAAEGVKPYARLWNGVQLADLRGKIEDRETLTVLGIPRLSLFYA